VNTFKHRLARKLTAAGVLAALTVGIMPPAQAALANAVSAVRLTQVTGTAPFDADDLAGNDSSGSNTIIRTNDTVQYNPEITVGTGGAAAVHVLLDLPKGEQATSLPPYCLSGSSISPAIADPGPNLTATSWTNLPSQTIDCYLGDLPAGSSQSYPLYSRVRPEVPNGTTLAPVDFTAVSGTVAKTSTTVTHKVSATGNFDTSIGFSLNANGGYVWGPTMVQCDEDPAGCMDTHAINVFLSVPRGGRGASPLQNGFTMTMDLSAVGVFGSQITSTPAWIAAGANAEAKYRPVISTGSGCLNSSYTGHGPWSAIGYKGSAKATADNSVRNSGTVACTMDAKGIVKMTFTGVDTTGWTSPSTTNYGSALPNDRAYVISKEFGILVPVTTVKDLGIKTSGSNVWTLPQNVAISEVSGKTLSGAAVATTAFTKTNNNYKKSSLVAKNEGTHDAFWTGLPGTRGNTPSLDFRPSWSEWEGLPGQGNPFSGDGVLLQDQVGVLTQVEEFQTMDPGFGSMNCSVWNNKQLALAADDYPGSTESTRLQAVGSDGAAVWISGGYDSAYRQIDASYFEVQYGYGPVGTGTASTCNNADSTVGWFTSPTNAAFNNDATRAAAGTYTGVNKVRVLMKTPVLGRSIINLSVAVRYIGNQAAGTTIPFYGSFKPIKAYSSISAAISDTANPWTTSTYTTGPTSTDMQSGGFGGRALVGMATSRIATEVKGLDGVWTTGTPAYVAGTTVQARLSPTITAPVDTDKSYPMSLEACLPVGVSYVAGSSTVTPGTAQLVPGGQTKGSTVTCTAGMTYMVWNMGRRVPNAVIPPVVFSMRIKQTTVNGTLALAGAVMVTGDPSPADRRTDTAMLQVQSPVGIKIARTATESVIEVNPATSLTSPRTMTWDTEFANMNAPSGISNVEIVEVLPRNGYGASNFTGTFQLKSVSVIGGTGVTLEYTSTAGLTISSSGVPSAATWTATAPTTAAGWTALTGVRIKRANTFAPGDDLAVRFTALPMNNNGGDIYAGQVAGKATGLAGAVGPLETTVQVVESSIGDRAWVDQNKNGLQDAGEKGLSGQKVTLTGNDSDGNALTARTTTTDANGNYSFDRLASGSYGVSFDKASLDSRYLTVTKFQVNKGTNDSCAYSSAVCNVVLGAGEDRKDIDMGVTAVTSLTLSTVASPASGAYVAPKDTVSFTMTIKNSGQQPYTSATALDTLSPEYTIVPGSIVPSTGSASATASSTAVKITWTGPLAAGATATVTFKATVDQDTAEETELTSRMTGSGTWFGGVQPSSCDLVTSTASCATLHNVAWPHLALVTTVARPVSDGTTLAKIDENLAYTSVLKNTGKVNVINKTGSLQVPVGNDLTGTDGPVTPLNFGAAATALAPNASITAAAKVYYKVTQDDVDWGAVTAVSDASGTTVAGFGTDAEQVITDQDVAQVRSLAMRASVTDDSNDGIAQAGEEMIYRYKVVNTGTVSIDSAAITDTYLKGRRIAVTPEHTFDGRLSPAESVTFISSPVVVLGADKTVGSLSGTSYAAGIDRRKVSVKSNTDELVILTPSPSGLDVVKRATDAGGDGFADKGEKLTYTFTVTNNSDTDFHAVSISDPMLGAAGVAVTAQNGFNGVLAPRQSATFISGQYTVTTADLTAGTVKNIATATALDSLNDDVTSNASTVSLPTATTPVIVKTGSGAGPAESVGLVPGGAATLKLAAGGLLGAAALCMLFLAFHRRRRAL
jgi:uncharacterized repeat protein (TIGR01451 family)